MHLNASDGSLLSRSFLQDITRNFSALLIQGLNQQSPRCGFCLPHRYGSFELARGFVRFDHIMRLIVNMSRSMI
jgi:hypothetical protein